MTRLISLGLHRPSALQYLIDEGILQHEPKPGSYTWKSYSVPDQMVEEEVLWTKNYVAYSRDGYIQRIFNYTEKDDDVHDAVLTFFTSPACINEESHAGTTAQISADQDVEPRESGPFGRLRRKSRRSSIGPAPEEGAKRSNTSARTGQRALVILIGKQCHIHFLTGSTHVVSIPFQVSKVFPMREGIILQRNVASRPKSAGKVPAPPPNSFFSSQPQFSPFARSPLVPGKGIPNFLLFDSPSKRLSISSASANIGMDVDESDFPHFWSLTDPLSDFSAIASATVAPLPRHLRTDDAGMIVEYDDIDASETLIYVSQNDEFATGPSAGKVALMLFVTMNDDLDQVTIWQGWYLKPRSLSDLMAVRKAVQQLKEAGRSSVNTAATAGRMPGVRFHDKGRESFAATAELPKKKAAGRRKKSQPVAKSDAKEEEVDMALRMDPDFPSGRQPTKGPRRTGSLLSRGDLSTHDPTRGHSAVGGSHAASARRGPSMRMSQDRRSFGTSMYRKSRGSVPGSTFSRSLGPEDENSMDLDDDSFLEGELEAEITRVTELFLATHDFASVESTFAFGADGIKPELVLRKVHVLPLSTPRTSHQESGVDTRFKVHTLSQQAEINSQDGTITMWIHDKTLQRTLRANFDVVLAPIGEHATPPLNRVALMAIPLFRNQEIQSATADIAEVIDGPFRAVVSSTESGLLVAPQDSQPWLTSTPRSLRLHDSADVQNDLTLSHREVGLNRLVDLADSKFDLSTSVKPAHVYAEDSSGHKFDLEVKFRPRNQFVDRALQIARLVLHGKAKRSVLWLWASALIHVRAQKLAGDTEDVLEFEALAVFLLSYSVGSLGRATPKARRSHPNIPPLDGELLPQPDTQVERNVTSLTTTWQTLALGKATSNGSKPSRRISKGATVGVTSSPLERILFTDVEAKTRSLLLDLYSDGHTWLMDAADTQERVTTTLKLMLAMQLLREEIKLNPFEGKSSEEVSRLLAMCLCQLGHYLRRDSWDWKLGTQLAAEIAYTNYGFSDSEVVEAQKLIKARCPPPFSMNVWLQVALTQRRTEPLPDLMTIAALGSEHNAHGRSTSDQMLTLPRLTTLSKFLERISASSRETYQIVEIMQQTGMSEIFLATLPESTAGYLREYIAVCRVSPPSTWSSSLLRMVDREDLMLVVPSEAQLVRPGIHQRHVVSAASDLYALLSSTERPIPLSRSHEADRHAIIAQIFSEDRRFVDAARLTNSANLQVAECPPQPGYSDEEHLEQQKKVMQWVMIRTVALPAGSAMIHFESQKPLISEKFQVAGFSTICQMKPMDNTVSADKTGFTEEKLSWAFFHAGASAGLHISRKAAGIDTSWVVFNKPDDLTNRHAGFLLALGLNGHLRKMAKWLAFKYLTPKHTMTSIGLLLGLSASYMGTMDSLITRMLSVHITRMLPPGAAELNVSPLTQAVGLLGVGLLYYNTQHRRMSEIMLSELEHRDIEEAGSAADRLRDESYRLAAGFSLGVMNLGKGNNLQGLQGMGLLERLLSIAIGPRPVELVHVVDKATAGATVALAFIYMKTNDPTIARKIDIPDTVSQLDHIRPDILLLRTLAKNLIMWNDITATEGCIKSQLPSYASHYFSPKTSALLPLLPLRSSEIPLFNIITGHAWSLALKHAGTASLIARDEILAYLDVFWSTSLQPATYYDAQLARTTIRRCVDMLALSAATVMAGTGDVKTFRYLRRLHGRTDAETTYGSHMAAHLAVGTLFLGGGTYTFSTSDLAIAGLVMAFYPLWPQEVLDNAVHLQAFRHLWVLAAEARCVVCQDVDSGRPVQMDVRIRMRDGEEVVRKAPCLLPELESVASVETVERGWWKAKWDFERNVSHRRAFKEEQTLWVRRAPAKEENPGLFARALKRLNESGNMPDWWRIWAELLKLPAFECLEESELGLAIPANATSGVHEDAKGTVLDDRLVLLSDAKSWDPQRLWNIRLLLSWAERKRQENDGSLQWLGDEFVQRLSAIMQRRMAEVHGKPVAR